MLKKILFALIAAIAVFCVAAAMQPAEFSVTRSIAIAAPAGKLFPEINDLHRMDAWSPWSKLDPNAKNTYEGPASGVGAKLSWDGNMEVGKGAMTITESEKNQRVKYRLDFEKPMKGTSDAELRLSKQEGATLVTWSMSGKNDFLGKAMSLIFNCEKMIGEQFDKGLLNLKGLAEKK